MIVPSSLAAKILSLGVVDSVRQRIDIVSAALDIGDILDISLDRKAAVREFLTQISLDTHIIYLSVHLYAVADTVRIEPLQISKFQLINVCRSSSTIYSLYFSKEMLRTVSSHNTPVCPR